MPKKSKSDIPLSFADKMAKLKASGDELVAKAKAIKDEIIYKIAEEKAKLAQEEEDEEKEILTEEEEKQMADELAAANHLLSLYQKLLGSYVTFSYFKKQQETCGEMEVKSDELLGNVIEKWNSLGIQELFNKTASGQAIIELLQPLSEKNSQNSVR